MTKRKPEDQATGPTPKKQNTNTKTPRQQTDELIQELKKNEENYHLFVTLSKYVKGKINKVIVLCDVTEQNLISFLKDIFPITFTSLDGADEINPFYNFKNNLCVYYSIRTPTIDYVQNYKKFNHLWPIDTWLCDVSSEMRALVVDKTRLIDTLSKDTSIKFDSPAFLKQKVVPLIREIVDKNDVVKQFINSQLIHTKDFEEGNSISVSDLCEELNFYTFDKKRYNKELYGYGEYNQKKYEWTAIRDYLRDHAYFCGPSVLFQYKMNYHWDEFLTARVHATGNPEHVYYVSELKYAYADWYKEKFGRHCVVPTDRLILQQILNLSSEDEPISGDDWFVRGIKLGDRSGSIPKSITPPASARNPDDPLCLVIFESKDVPVV